MALPDLSQKQAQVNYTSAQKRAAQNNGLPVNSQDFQTLFPNATPEDKLTYEQLTRNQQFANNQLTQAMRQQQRNNNPYSVGEFVGDSTNSLIQGAVGLGEILYGTADLASRYNLASQAYNAYQQLTTPEGQAAEKASSLDDVIGLSQNFGETQDILDSWLQSDNEAQELADIQASQQSYGQQVDAETVANIQAGKNAWLETAKGLGKKAYNTAKEYASRPGLILQETIEELPQILSGGTLGKASISLAQRGLRPDQIKLLMEVPQYKKRMTRIAEAAGVGTAALSEAMSNAVETKADILDMSEKELTAQSPAYNELRAMNLSHEEAQMRLSDQAFDIVTALTLPTAGVTAKLTGAGQLEGTLFLKGSNLAGTIQKNLAATGIEGLEEAVQSGTGQVAQNFAVQQTGNENQEILENVGEAIGQGAAVGAGVGLTMTGVLEAPEILDSLSADTKKTVEAVDKAGKKAARKLAAATQEPEVKEAVKTGDATKVTNPELESYKPESAVTALLNPKFIPVRDEANGETEEDYQVRKDAYVDEVKKHGAKMMQRVMRLNETDTAAAGEYMKNVVAPTRQQMNGVIDNLRDNKPQAAIDLLKKNQATPEAKAQVLGSMRDGFLSSITEEEATEVLNSTDLNDTERQQVQSFIQTKRAEAVLNREGKSGRVSREILNGSAENLGLSDYTTMVNASVAEGNTEDTKIALKQLREFANTQVTKAKLFNETFNRALETGEEQNIKVGNRTYNINSRFNNTGFLDRVNEDTQAVINTFTSLRDYAATAFEDNTEVTSQAPDVEPAPTAPITENVEDASTTSVTENVEATSEEAQKPQTREERQAEVSARINSTRSQRIPQSAFETYTQTPPAELTDEQITSFLNGDVELDDDNLTDAQNAELDAAIESIDAEGVRRGLFEEVAPESGYGLLRSIQNQAAQIAWEVDLAERNLEAERINNESTPESIAALENVLAEAKSELSQMEESFEAARERYPEDAERLANDNAIRRSGSSLASNFNQSNNSAETDRINVSFNKGLSMMTEAELNRGLTRRRSLLAENEESLSPRAIQNIQSEIQAIENQLNSQTENAPDSNEGEGTTNVQTEQSTGTTTTENQQDTQSDETEENADATEESTTDDRGIDTTVEREYLEGTGSVVEGVPYLNGKRDNNRIGDWFQSRRQNNVFATTQDIFEEASTISDEGDLDESAITFLTKFRDTIGQALNSMVGLKDDKFAHQSMIQMLLNDGSDNYAEGLDTNVLNALAISALKWMDTRGTESQNRTIADIAQLTGLNEEYIEARPDIIDFYMDKGIPSQIVTQNLGREAMRMLRLRAKGGADYNAQNKMEHSLGVSLMMAMAKTGLIEVNDADGMFVNGVFDKNKTFRHVTMLDNNTVKRVQDQYPTISAFIDDVTGTDQEYEMPSFSKPERIPSTVQNSSQKLSDSQKGALRKYANRAFKFDEQNMMVWDMLGDEAMMDILGYDRSLKVNNGQPYSPQRHITKWMGIQGRNNQIERSIENLRKFREHVLTNGAGMGQDFYFNSVVDGNNRFRMNSKVVNPQGDKFHRHMIKMDGWDYEVNDDNSRRMFKLALGQALDIKIDKLTADTALRQVDAIMAGEGEKGRLFRQAVGAIRQLTSGNAQMRGNQDAARRAIVDAVNAFGEKTHTLAGLVAAANYSETESFTSSLPLEIDGVTNGTALALLQFAPGTEPGKLKQWLARVGIFMDKTISYGLARESGEVRQDNYEKLATAIQQQLHSIMQSKSDITKKNGDVITSLEDIATIRQIGNVIAQSYSYLTGKDTSDKARDKLDLFGLARDVAKNPVMIGNYGAGNNKIIAEFAAEVESRLYANIEDAVSRGAQDELDLIARDLSDILGRKVPRITLNNGLRFTLDTQDSAMFNDRVTRTFGEAMKAALELEFEDIQEARSKFNHMVSAMNAMFRNAWDYEYKKIMEEKGVFTVDDQRALESKLKRFRPEIQHLQSGRYESVDTHIDLSDNSPRESENFEDKLEIPLRGKLPNNNTAKTGKQVQTYADSINWNSLGARPTVYGIQSSDSGIMVESLLADYPSLNIYDAVIVKPTDAMKAANTLNKATYQLNKKHSLYESAARNLVTAMREYPSEYGATLAGYMEEELNPFGLSFLNPRNMVQDAVRSTPFIQGQREQMFKDITYTTQYNFEVGGHFSNVDEAGLQARVDAFVKGVKRLDGLGSAPGQFQQSANMSEYALDTSTALGLMTTLRNGSTVKSSAQHEQWLDDLIGNTYNTLITPMKLKVGVNANNQNQGVYDFTKKEVRINVNNGVQQSSMEMGADEVFAHEVVHGITKTALEGNSNYSREVRALWARARKYITPDDLRSPNDSADEAQARWDYIFNNPDKINGIAVGLHEFVAFGLTNEKMRQALAAKVPTTPEMENEGGSILNRLRNLYTKFIRMFSERIRNVRTTSADQQLVDLVKQMVEAENNGRRVGYQTTFANKIDDKVKQSLIRYIQKPLLDLLSSQPLTRPTNSRVLGTIQGMAAAGRIAVSGEFGEYRKVLNRVATRMGATENNIFVSMLNEAQGRTDDNNKFYELARESRKVIDQARAEIAANVKKHMRNQFLEELSTEDEIALTKVIFKTDLASLTEDYSLEEIHGFLTDPKKLQAAIVKHQKDLQQFGNDRIYYNRMAMSLGNFMVTGKFTEKFGLMNAHAISRLVGTSQGVPAHADKAEPIIDRLATLAAIQKLANKEPDTLAQVVAIADREFQANLEDNGITFTLLSHADYKERSLEQLFNGNKMQMQKGYIREIYNPNKSFVVAPEADAELLGKDGYTRVGSVSKDSDDPDKQPRAMFISDMGTLAPWQAGTVSIANMTARGTPYYQASYRPDFENNPFAAWGADPYTEMEQAKSTRANDIYSGVAKIQESINLVPVLDEAGKIVNYRYMMQESTKHLLDRNMRITDVMGAMEGNLKSKLSGNEINEKTVDALVEDYRTNYNRDPERYVLVGLQSTRDDLKELYQMLPQPMREQIKAETGQDGIFVKQELVKLLFGQRKFSVAHYFREKQRLRTLNGETTNMYMERVYRALGSSKTAKVEQVWQEMIAYVKDTIVIKSFTTLIGNIASNNLLLWSMGVPLKNLFTDQERAYRYAEEHQANQSRIEEIEREIKVESKKTSTPARAKRIANLESEKTKLEDAQAVNPVTPLIEAGVYQSIIEDVDMLDDEYSYKSQLEEWASPVTDRIPSQIKTVGGYVTLSRDNKLYQILRKTTQMSDFAARFALHEHNLSKGMSTEDSVNMIVDTFIDYDLPTHSSIEYLNSVGGVFFTKYFLRVQKIILANLASNPARVLGLELLQELWGNVSDITDSFALFKDIGFMFKDPVEALSGWWDMFPWVQMVK